MDKLDYLMALVVIIILALMILFAGGAINLKP
jgi:hypothetical protein